MRVVGDLLENRGGSYILPFFWMHGEPHEVLLEELDRIASCGIREVCLESRPHPDFCGPGWWRDLDVLIAEARRRQMRVWVLDDDKFPTGHANGAFERQHPELAKWYLAERHIDVRGPAEDLSVLIAPFLGADGRLLGVLACPRTDPDTMALSGSGCLDLAECVDDGFVTLDLPAGDWRIVILFTTQAGGGRPAWMNLLDSRSVQVLIDAVYEPHYAHYRDDFGKTFAGFFSDEPEIGNLPGYDFGATLGKPGVRLPWSDELETRLRARWASGFLSRLPALWYDNGPDTSAIRSSFMDEVTRLVDVCLAGQIGAWCAARDVEYIGHIIEDDNAHARLGCSIGHYFRQQRGQHMAGVDVVHVQIAPGMHGRMYRSIAGDGDGEFSHFGLAKLASSQAALDPHKQGRALCEIFGNYGWALGVPLMKWLTDHMLVRGINRFVPHAFSPRFPDRDCPPHFYARGHNATFPFFQLLMRYMNRCCHLLDGGVRRTDCAVLYHAESEWGGGAMLFQLPVRRLLEAQLDCDVVPVDLLAAALGEAAGIGVSQDGAPHPDAVAHAAASFTDGRLLVNGRSYGCLVIPCCERIPPAVARFVERTEGSGFAVCVMDAAPVSETDGTPLSAAFVRAASIVPLEALGEWVRGVRPPETSIPGAWPDLRLLRLERPDGMVLLCFNESVDRRVETRVFIREGHEGGVCRYDAQDNVLFSVAYDGRSFPLVLEPGESHIYLLPVGAAMPVAMDRDACPGEVRVLRLDWTVSTADPAPEPAFEYRWTVRHDEPLPNLNGPGRLPRFSGWFRYEASWTMTVAAGARYWIRFPRISDCARLEINGRDAGMLLGSPFRREVTGLVADGENRIVVTGCNTLAWQIRDGASTHLPLRPTGITQPPLLEMRFAE